MTHPTAQLKSYDKIAPIKLRVIGPPTIIDMEDDISDDESDAQLWQGNPWNKNPPSIVSKTADTLSETDDWVTWGLRSQWPQSR